MPVLPAGPLINVCIAIASTDYRRRDEVLAKILERLNKMERAQEQALEALRAGSLGAGQQLIKRLDTIQELEELDRQLGSNPQIRMQLVRTSAAVGTFDLNRVPR